MELDDVEHLNQAIVNVKILSSGPVDIFAANLFRSLVLLTKLKPAFVSRLGTSRRDYA